MSYAVYFAYNGITYMLPVNPEQIETSSVQANEKYEILKLGQIVVPSHMELAEYSFEAEFPHSVRHYVETSGGFQGADFYLKLFEEWRNALKPVQFMASNEIGEDINSLVLIEELTTVEKAGEEGDKYVSFKLVEYREFSKRPTITQNGVIVNTLTAAQPEVNPKSSGSYTVVSGDSLWAIAKKYYGDGNQYPKIFNANKDKIKNPSLIYPGQVLLIP